MTVSSSTVALVGSWLDLIDDRRSATTELALAWSHDATRVSVFTDATPTIREELAACGVTCWPEGAFGRHFAHHEFDHAVVMIGPRLDSVLALARSADEGSHVWLQHDVVDSDGFPIDAPDGWLVDVIASARSVIVGSDWLAGVVRRLSPDGPPVLVMPPAHPVVEPIIETPDRSITLIGGGERVHQYLADTLSTHIIRLDVDDMTSSVREPRVLSTRAGVEIRTNERGFASTTVTHMMARGIPTITNLDAHSAFASGALATSGLVIVDGDERSNDEIGATLVELLRPVLDDDREWLAASTAAKATAASWTWSDAADVLAQWMSAVDELEPSTVRVVGSVGS